MDTARNEEMLGMAHLPTRERRLGRVAGPGKGERWGLILAGGDGTRLRTLTRRIAGDERPKQFCRILGSEQGGAQR